MMSPNLPIELVFKNVRIAVDTKTNGRQLPTTVSSIVGDFSFVNQALDSNQHLTHLLEQLNTLKHVRPISSYTIEKLSSLYDQIHALQPNHPVLTEKTTLLAILHSEAIRHLLQQPAIAIRSLTVIDRHAYQLSMLAPNKDTLSQINHRLTLAYRTLIGSLKREERTKDALALCQQALQITENHYFSEQCKQLNARASKKNPKLSRPTTKERISSPPQIEIKYTNLAMNCAGHSARFTMIPHPIKLSSTQRVVVDGYISDQCTSTQWLPLDIERTLPKSLRSCEALEGHWSLITAEDMEKLITSEQVPGHGGMIDPRFFITNRTTAPQKTYWTSSSRGGRFILINGINGQPIITIDRNKVGYVICKRESNQRDAQLF